MALHSEAAAFVDHYGFASDVVSVSADRKGGWNIVRDHVLASRSFDSIAELDTFVNWLQMRRRQVHRTHGLTRHSIRPPERLECMALTRRDVRSSVEVWIRE